MEKVKVISPFRLASLLRLQKDPKLAFNLFINPNPTPNLKPFRYSLLSYDLIITKLGKSKMFNEMEQIIQKLKQETHILPKEIIFCNIITFYGRARLPDRALHMFEQIPSFRCQRTAKSLNTLLNALLVCKEFDKLSEIVESERYACPDVCSYNIMINARCFCNDIDGARKVFDEMRKRRVRPNVVTFGTMINWLCSNFKLDEGFKLKENMVRVFNVTPNAFIYVSLIKGLCKVGKLELAFELKEEMLVNEVKFDSAVYTTLIAALFKAGRGSEVSLILKEMRMNGCKPDTVTYNAMIHGFCNAREFDLAFGVLKEMEENECKPDVISYNVIIGGLCREGKVSDANELFEDMPRRKCVPDVLTYRILLDGFCNGLQFKEAAGILDEMVFKEYVPRIKSVNILLEGLFQGGELKLLWSALNSLVKENFIDGSTWEMLISMVCSKDKLLSSCKFVDILTL